MFQSTIFFKGHLFCFVSVLSDTDIGFSLVQFHRPKEWSALLRKSLLFAKESRIYHQVLHSPEVRAKDTVCLSRVSSTLAIAITITCNGGIHVDLVGSGKGAKSSAHQRRGRGLSGQGRGVIWVGHSLIICASPSLDT